MSNERTTKEVDALVLSLAQGDTRARARAAETLGRLGAAARAAAPALIVALSDPEARVRTEAGQALFEIGPDARAVPALVHGLTDERSHVRFHSARALAKTQPSPIDALPGLLALLRDEEEWPVVDSVWWALHVIGPPSVLPLAEMLQSGDRRTRCRAAYCLMSGSVDRLRQSILPLLAALSDDERVRGTALQSLGWNAARYKRATGTLDEAWAEVPRAVSPSLADAQVWVRRQAARVLLQFGAAAWSVTDELAAAARDDDETVRTWATLTLEEIRRREPDGPDAMPPARS